jgi:CRISPR-associated protein Cmr4
MKHAAMVFLHALSPLHAGTGQGIGAIDLPIAREKATGIPYLPGSSLKGVLRDRAAPWDPETRFAVFGPDTESASEHAGAVQVGDAKLLLFPVRSLYGVFALVTSPYLLERFRREAEMVGLCTPEILEVQDPGQALLARDSRVLGDGGKVYLEDLDLEAREEAGARAWEDWLAQHLEAPVKGRLVVVHDDLMGYLLETATEVVARIRLDDETKTVAPGALWYEESLPTESVLYSLLRTEASRRKGQNLPAEAILAMVKGLLEGPVQLGGKATVGRGLCIFKVVGGPA